MRTDFTTVFDLDLPFGRCIGVQKNEATSLEHWHPEEIAFANILASNRESFLLGRLALRQMIDTSQPILRTEHGAPDIPSGWMASVSHMRDVGVALVAPAEPNVYVGVDVELQSSRRNIARKILTEREQGELGKLEASARDVCSERLTDFRASTQTKKSY